MMPIQQLLSRIRWDEDFAQAEFSIGYYDRLADRIVRIPLGAMHFEPDIYAAFEFIDDQGERHSVPLHRIREVYRNRELIWRRGG